MAHIPGTPRVISPTPSASDTATDSYFPPTTRSATAKRRPGAPAPLTERSSREASSSSSSSSDLDARRARSRSRSADASLRSRRLSGKKKKPPPGDLAPATPPNGAAPQPNGYLSPGSYWRDFSRSPSPLGLIPLHRSWRQTIHKHELPRKALHVSIGFLTLRLYATNRQTSDIHPVLLYALIPIASLDLLRHNWPPFNRAYVRVCGAFMREAEVHARYNGVIWYLLGAWAAMRFFPKDVGVLSIVLLSWCDTAASTIGRWLGRHTPRVRKGKSLAGSAAAFFVGAASAAMFWGWLAPLWEADGSVESTGVNAFAFQGRLGLPESVKGMLGWNGKEEGMVEGAAAVGIMSVVAGVVASVSEAIDVGGLDDNVTIPVLCGIGLWGFLKIFG